MGMKIGELFVSLGINADIAKLNEFTSGMRRGVLESAAFIAGLVGITMTLKEIITGAVDTASSLREFRATTGLSTAELQKWQLAGEKVGIKTESMMRSIKGLNNALSSAKYGKGVAEGFMFLGVPTSGNAFDALLKIRKEIQGMEKTRATYLLGTMGISEEMMNLLNLPEDKFKSIFPTSEDLFMLNSQEEITNKMMSNLIEIKQIWNDIARDILVNLLPAMDKISEKIKHLTSNKSGESKFMKMLGDIVERQAYEESRTGKSTFANSWVGQAFFSDPSKYKSVDDSLKQSNVNVTIHNSGNRQPYEDANQVRDAFIAVDAGAR